MTICRNMHWPSLWQWLLLALWVPAIGAVPQSAGLTVQPAQIPDPFYLPPENIDSYPPGAIMRYREPPQPITAFQSVPIDVQKSYQILYRTADNFNKSTATVLTVLVPRNANFNKMLSYQMAIDSSDYHCIPSVAMQKSKGKERLIGTALTQLELLLVAQGLARGWVVIIPDHGGPESAFLANRLAGQATLDGIRAALGSTDITGISKDARVVMWGYSGGSLASGWAAELQPTYAPELKIAGAALGGIVPRIRPVLTVADKTFFAGLLPSGIFGLSYQYPEVKQIIDQHVKPSKKATFLRAAHSCIVDVALNFLYQDIKGYFDDPRIFDREPVTSILRANDMGHATPQIPIYAYKPVQDEISLIGDTDALISRYCESGASVEYVRISNAEHALGAVTGFPGAINWLVGIMDGQTAPAGCSTRTKKFDLFSPEVFKAIPPPVLRNFLQIFKGKLF